MIGKKLSQYEIIGQIGLGGMGEVYRARDTRLGRDVAIKILPREMSGDPERVARFQREARTLASLQHANIAAVYGYEEAGGVRFLAMELVEGSNLADRLESGPVAEDEAREIIRKIAAGLDEAHRNGIMHRDLKPANVMITSDGEVKILDFGLARAYAGDTEDGSNPALSPTITAAMTEAGTILGTAAYMSPEQARGRRVDHRADIWAMGVILFELLVGRRLFEGESTTDILASVIKIEPNLDLLPPGTRSSTRRMLRKCLQRDPRQRLHSAADAALELDEPEATPAGTPAVRKPFLAWTLVVVLALALASQLMLRGDNRAPAPLSREYQLDLPSSYDPTMSYRPVASPDGKWVVTLITDAFGHHRLHLRSLVDGTSSLLEEESSGQFPFWSADSRFLGFFAAGRLRKLHLESGSVQIIRDRLPGDGRGGSWSENDDILFAPGPNADLFLVRAEGGDARQITTLDTMLVDGSHRWPSFLPDGRRFVFTIWSNVLEERSESGGIYISDLDGSTPRRLLRDVSAAIIVPTGQLMFHRNGKLMAVEFDLQAGVVGEAPILVSDKVAFLATNGLVGASSTAAGDVFVSQHTPSRSLQLAWVDANGERVEDVGPVLPLTLGTRLSSTEKHYALELLDDVGSVEIWIGDVERGTRSRLSKFDSDCWGVQFSADAREVAYCVQIADGGRLYRQEITGALDPRPILEFPEAERVVDVVQWPRPELMFVEARSRDTGQVGIRAVDPESGEIRDVLMDDYAQRSPALSPDGRWLAYVSQESGRQETYVRSWPDLDRKWRVSREGGGDPRWNRAGNRLQFIAASAPEIREVDFEVVAGDPDISLPRVAMTLPPNIMGVEIGPDLDRYLIGFVPEIDQLLPARVLVGWGANTH